MTPVVAGVISYAPRCRQVSVKSYPLNLKLTVQNFKISHSRIWTKVVPNNPFANSEVETSGTSTPPVKTKTITGMIIHHAGRLHKRVADSATDKLEAILF